MTKKPYEVEPPRQPTKAEREARKAFREVDAKKAISDHDLAQKAFLQGTPESRAAGTRGRGVADEEQGLMASPSNRWTPEEDALFRSMAEANTRPENLSRQN
jgi:hypothetical protein